MGSSQPGRAAPGSEWCLETCHKSRKEHKQLAHTRHSAPARSHWKCFTHSSFSQQPSEIIVRLKMRKPEQRSKRLAKDHTETRRQLSYGRVSLSQGQEFIKWGVPGARWAQGRFLTGGLACRKAPSAGNTQVKGTEPLSPLHSLPPGQAENPSSAALTHL